MNIDNFGKGAIHDSQDVRDFKYSELMAAGEPFDWTAGFDIEQAIDTKLKVSSQDGSSSCVGQSWAKYAEVLEIAENKNFTDLSAKDVYQRIFNPTYGGAEIRLGAKLLTNLGVNTELDVPSYEDGNPPSETYMRTFQAGDPNEALIYSAKSYASVIPTSIDHIACVIRDNSGCVSGFNGDNEGWATAFVKPPISVKWGHAVYLGRAKMINGKKMIGFINSWGAGWGDNGWGWFDESYLSNIFSLWTLVDRINPINKTMKLGIDSNNNQYLIDEETRIALSIADEKALAEIMAHYKKFAPAVKFDPLGYLVFKGATSLQWKNFLNL